MTMSHKNFVVSMVFAGLAGCAGDQVATGPEDTIASTTATTHIPSTFVPGSEANTGTETVTSSQSAMTTLSFTDLDTFDQDLSNALKNNSETVSIAFVAPATINQIPPRLAKWLNIVQEGGGTVTMEPRTRSFLSLLFMLPAAYSYLKESALYSSVKNYNAVLSYKIENGQIQKFWFTKKKTETSESQPQ